VTVTIVDSAHRTVATVASAVRVPAHSLHVFAWHGRTDSGGPAPDGVYYPWVHLPRRTFRLINKITLDTVPPKVLSAKRVGSKAVFFAGRGRSVAVHYAFSENAHALVYLGRRQVVLGRRTRPSAKVKWSGKLGHEPLRAGTYVLSIGAQDLAGNVTPAAERKTVTVVLRYIRLSPERLTVRRGARLAVRVETAARRYTWRLGHRHGERRGKVLSLRAPTTPGKHRLVVTANGHTATAVVRVSVK
jgi:hypothetical protein